MISHRAGHRLTASGMSEPSAVGDAERYSVTSYKHNRLTAFFDAFGRISKFQLTGSLLRSNMGT